MPDYVFFKPGADAGLLLFEANLAGIPVSLVLGPGDSGDITARSFLPLDAAQQTALAALVTAHDPASARLAATRVRAKDVFQASMSDAARRDRAIALVVLDEINFLRQRLRAQDAAVAAATSLADLKTRWAALATAAPLPDRTPLQAKNAVLGRIDTSDAD